MLKRHSQLWDRADLDTSFYHFEKITVINASAAVTLLERDLKKIFRL